MLSRRHLLENLLTSVCVAALPSVSLADNGSGSSGGGSSNSDGGSDGGGSGENSGHDGNENDAVKNQDDARGAVLKGDATALRDILVKVRRIYQGDIVHIDLKGPSHRLFYQIRLIDLSGKFLNLRVDAKSGAILGQSGN